MSDNESDVSEGELLKDWTLVHDIDDYDLQSDDSSEEGVTVNGCEGTASFHSSRVKCSISVEDSCARELPVSGVESDLSSSRDPPLISVNDTSNEGELLGASNLGLSDAEADSLPICDPTSGAPSDDESRLFPTDDFSSDRRSNETNSASNSASSMFKQSGNDELMSNLLENWVSDDHEHSIANLEVTQSQVSCSSSGSSISFMEIIDQCSSRSEASLDASGSVESLCPEEFVDESGSTVLPPFGAGVLGEGEGASRSQSTSPGIDKSMSSSGTVVSSTEDEVSLHQSLGEPRVDVTHQAVVSSIFQNSVYGVDKLFEDPMSSKQSSSGGSDAISEFLSVSQDTQNGAECEPGKDCGDDQSYSIQADCGLGDADTRDFTGPEDYSQTLNSVHDVTEDASIEREQLGGELETVEDSDMLGIEECSAMAENEICLDDSSSFSGLRRSSEADLVGQVNLEQAEVSIPMNLGDNTQPASGSAYHRVEYEDLDVDEMIAATEDMADDAVDDRCESDISGVATDDTDLSTLSTLDDMCLVYENAQRTYRHQPNSAFNSTLTCVTLMALCFAVGIGLGHYIGSTRGSSLNRLQLGRMKSMQDEYYVCLNQLIDRRVEQDQDIAMVTAMCQQRNEGIATERRVFEYQLNSSMNEMHRLGIAIAREHRRYTRAVRVYIENKKTLNTTRLLSKINERKMLEFKTCCNDQRQAVSHLNIELTESQAGFNVTMADVIGKLEQLKNTANRLRMENVDLRNHIRRLRYTEHPGNSNGSSTAETQMDDLKNSVNRLTIENEDLKSYVRSLRYHRMFVGEVNVSREDRSDEPMDPASVDGAIVAPTIGAEEEDPMFHDIKSTERRTSPSNHSKSQLSIGFHHLQKLVDSIVDEWLNENGTEVRHLDPLRRLPVFVTLLKRLVALVGNSTAERLDVPIYHEAIVKMADCIETLKNASIGNHISNVLTSTWDRFSDRLPGLGLHDVNVAYETCGRQLNVDQLPEGPPSRIGRTERVKTAFHSYMNKTLETVTKLNIAVQTTLNHLRTIPGELFAENKSAKKIAGKISGVIAKLENRLRSGWSDVKSTCKKWYGSNNNKMERSHNLARPAKQTMKNLTKNRVRGGGGSVKEKGEPGVLPMITAPVHDKYHQWFRKDTKPSDSRSGASSMSPGRRKDRSNHKQTRTIGPLHNPGQDKRRGAPLRYEEFWEDDSYDPDDYLPDGFFEGNHREWRRQHERRLRAVYGRLQRLNDDIFMSMDDDDVEELEEMVEDFAEDTEDRNEPVKFRTWISCQVRWWKSRLHRKHRSEDLAIGCGRQLMRWQLRVLCKEDPLSGDIAVLKNFCKTATSPDGVIKHKIAGGHVTGYQQQYPSIAANNKNKKKKKGDLGYSSDSHSSPKNAASSMYPPTGGCQHKMKSEVEVEKSTDTVELNSTRMWNGKDEDAVWYFRLAQHREDSQHQSKPADWYFQLMEDRQLERTDANWYVRSIRRRSIAGEQVNQLNLGDDDGIKD